MAEEYLVKEKKGNMSKIPYLLTPSNEFPGIIKPPHPRGYFYFGKDDLASFT